MTAKDKAKELFDKYCHAIRTDEDDDGYFTNIIHAKRCALLAVDEMISQMLSLMKVFNEDRSEFEAIELDYLTKVKQEIEKLCDCEKQI